MVRFRKKLLFPCVSALLLLLLLLCRSAQAQQSYDSSNDVLEDYEDDNDVDDSIGDIIIHGEERRWISKKLNFFVAI